MEFNLTSIDLQCRICLDMQQSIEEMTSLFEMMEGNFTLSDIFTNISNIELKAKADIPNNVCSSCLTTIINFHNLLLQFQETEVFLKNIVKESIKIDPPDTFDHNENCDNPEIISGKDLNEALDKFDKLNTEKLSHSEFEYNAEEENGDTNCCNNGKRHETETILQNSKCEIKNLKNEDGIVNDDSFESEKTIGETETDIIMESFKYTCEHCGDSYLYRISFNQHMLQKHNVLLKGKDFIKHSSKIIVKQPKMCPEFILLPKKKCKITLLQCKICKGSFKNETELKEHINGHKTHVCPVCGLAFLKKYYLTDHLVTHSSQRNYVCTICNASFKHRHGLSAHKNSHKTFRDYTCETCGHSFKDKGTLNIHIRLKHNDARDYACPECPLKFKLKSFLDKHFIRKHTERTKDFMCSACGVSYLNKSTLLRHISQKHSGKNPQFSCAICNKSFRVQLSLNKHLYSIHKICTYK